MEILIVFILIAANAVFSLGEIALVSLKKYKLEEEVSKGSRVAQKAMQLSNNPNTFFSAVQIGITVIGLLLGIYSKDSLSTPFFNIIAKIDFLQPYAQTLSILSAVIIVTYITILFGELIPKMLGFLYPEKIAKAIAIPMYWFSLLCMPFIWILSISNNFILSLFGINNKRPDYISEKDIKAIIHESTVAGEIQKIEQDIVTRVFSLGDRKVSEIMTHRNDLVWIDIQDNLETLKEKAGEELHSTYLVCDKSLDNWKGLIFVKELFSESLNSSNFNLKKFIKKPIIFPETTAVYTVLEKFKKHRIHYGLVVNEYGDLQGLVALDDVLDALLGDMSDMYQEDEFQIIPQEQNTWLADAQISFYLFCEYFKLNEENKEGNFNTLGGFVLEKLERIPKVGDSFNKLGFNFKVTKMDGVRIDKILITKKGA
ncbi:MAG: hemolysin family protein [Chitinophagales bacterium]|nr:hemolysin family protein [Chitinophagales bacterium]